MTKKNARPFAYDKAKDGWTLEADTPEAELFEPNQLELVSFLRERESWVSGEELMRRAVELKANLGQRQAEYLLKHQEQIPKEWRQYYIVFTGTTWRGRRGCRGVPCLYCFAGRWRLRFHWLGGGFLSYDRLVRPCE
jgi:hypothetical protein